MELRISRVKPKGERQPSDGGSGIPQGKAVSTADIAAAELPRQTVTLDNGVCLIKQGARYLMSIEGEEIDISEDELCRVYEHPELAFELVIEKKRKFWFSASIDNVGLLNHEI